jgi:hypothetical protein
MPARPSGKGRFSEGKAFGSGKGRISGARKEVELGLARSCAILNFDILRRAAFGDIWILIWGAVLGRNFGVNIGGLHERHAVQRGIWVPTQHLL